MQALIKLLCATMICALLLPIAAYAEPGTVEQFEIVTSFYPMYILTLNITAEVEGVEVVNMAQPTVGCLHDYTLTTSDMRLLRSADALVINGAGMETFIVKMNDEQSVPTIEASAGIPLLGEAAEAEADDEDDHAHAGHNHESEPNAHLWMSPRLAMEQTRNIANGLAELDPAHAAAYQANATAFIARLEALDSELHAQLAEVAGANMITSHPAFEYFAHEYGLNIIATLSQEPGEMPATRDMAYLVDDINGWDVKALFIEQLYPEKAAQILARETGIRIYELDSLTSGELEPGAYEAAMRRNAQILLEALNDE